MRIGAVYFSLCLLYAVGVDAVTPIKPTEPYRNPAWALSEYPLTHSRANFNELAGPVGPGHRLNDDEKQWRIVGPVNDWALLYSSPYPNGKRVIWVGGYDRVAKLDADTLETLATYVNPDVEFFSDAKVKKHIAAMDSMGDMELVELNHRVWETPFKNVMSFYRLLSRDNQLYLPYVSPAGELYIRVFGEKDPTDPASAIELRRQWHMPAAISSAASLVGMNMTSDGWLVLATMEGKIIMLDRDFSNYQVVKLPSKQEEKGEESINREVFSSFVRNGITIDDRDGLYVVTRDFMHRLQWTGEQLSMAETDGAWQASYPNGRGVGSGSTPGLMGWGPDEDHLVIIADGSPKNNLVVFWRDQIPADWQGIPGYDRRVAGITPVNFGVSEDGGAIIENGPVIYGYGAFFNNTYPVTRLPDQGSPARQWMAESFFMHVPGHEARGGTMVRWSPEQRKLTMAWNTQENLVSALCNVSGATETLYCWGARNREWTLEGFDWNTGNNVFHYTLGKSHRYNPLGGPVIIAPNGAVDCGCAGGMGIVRVNPTN